MSGQTIETVWNGQTSPAPNWYDWSVYAVNLLKGNYTVKLVVDRSSVSVPTVGLAPYPPDTMGEVWSLAQLAPSRESPQTFWGWISSACAHTSVQFTLTLSPGVLDGATPLRPIRRTDLLVHPTSAVPVDFWERFLVQARDAQANGGSVTLIVREPNLVPLPVVGPVVTTNDTAAVAAYIDSRMSTSFAQYSPSSSSFWNKVSNAFKKSLTGGALYIDANVPLPDMESLSLPLELVIGGVAAGAVIIGIIVWFLASRRKATIPRV